MPPWTVFAIIIPLGIWALWDIYTQARKKKNGNSYSNNGRFAKRGSTMANRQRKN